MGTILLMGAGKGNTYTPPAVWTPNDDASLLGWWDMTTPSSYSSGTWTKRWGTLNNLVAGGSGPTKITTGFSGDKDALVFVDTTDTGLAISSPGFTEVVVALAMEVKAITSSNCLVWNRGFLGVGTAGYLLVDTYGAQVKYRGGTDADYYSLTMPQQVLTVGRWSTSNRVLRINGAEVASSSATNSGTEAGSTETFELFRDTGTTNYSVHVAAVGIFTSAGWSTSLAEKIEGFICHNNIGHTTALLPGGHTYKSTPP